MTTSCGFLGAHFGERAGAGRTLGPGELLVAAEHAAVPAKGSPAITGIIVRLLVPEVPERLTVFACFRGLASAGGPASANHGGIFRGLIKPKTRREAPVKKVRVLRDRVAIFFFPLVPRLFFSLFNSPTDAAAKTGICNVKVLMSNGGIDGMTKYALPYGQKRFKIKMSKMRAAQCVDVIFWA